MGLRPYIILRCAISLDGYLDDSSDQRLLISNQEDFDAVDQLRATVDAILVGANTLRRDNPRLQVRSDISVQHRLASGLEEQPLRIAISNSGDLDPELQFFTLAGRALLFVPEALDSQKKTQLEQLCEIETWGREESVAQAVRSKLAQSGVRRLLVEGGGQILSTFLSTSTFDELTVSIAPFLLGQQGGSKFLDLSRWHETKRLDLTLHKIEQLKDVIALTYRKRGHE